MSSTRSNGRGQATTSPACCTRSMAPSRVTIRLHVGRNLPHVHGRPAERQNRNRDAGGAKTDVDRLRERGLKRLVLVAGHGPGAPEAAVAGPGRGALIARRTLHQEVERRCVGAQQNARVGPGDLRQRVKRAQ